MVTRYGVWKREGAGAGTRKITLRCDRASDEGRGCYSIVHWLGVWWSSPRPNTKTMRWGFRLQTVFFNATCCKLTTFSTRAMSFYNKACCKAHNSQAEHPISVVFVLFCQFSLKEGFLKYKTRIFFLQICMHLNDADRQKHRRLNKPGVVSCFEMER